MFKKITGTLLLANLACAAFAQDSTKTFALSGSVDAYYRVGGGKDSAGEIKTNNLTSFTNSANSFELGMLSPLLLIWALAQGLLNFLTMMVALHFWPPLSKHT